MKANWSYKILFPLIAFCFSHASYAQTQDDPHLIDKIDSLKIDAPTIIEGRHFVDGAAASDFGKISVFIYQAEEDTISGIRYAIGFAKGFTNRNYTRGLATYATALYNSSHHKGETYVEFFIDGRTWEYEDATKFSTDYASRLLPIFMQEYVERFGRRRILAEGVIPKEPIFYKVKNE